MAGVVFVPRVEGFFEASATDFHLGDAFYRDLHQRAFSLYAEGTEVSYEQLRQTVVSKAFDATTQFLRRSGTGVFGSRFRLRSDLNWDIDKGFRGGADIGLHLLPRQSDTTLGIQTGLVYWQGHREEERLDVHAGLVVRHRFGNKNPLVMGLSGFYDQNIEDDFARLGVGLDAQTRRLFLALNGYLALDSSWTYDNATSVYERRAVSGADMRLRLDWNKWLSTTAALGYWQKTQPAANGSASGWQFSAQGMADIYLHPSLALRIQYDHGSYNVDTGSDVLVGLHLQWPPRALPASRQGADLYRLVERETRLLYIERTRPLSSRASAQIRVMAQVSESQGDIVLDFNLTKPLDRNTSGYPAFIAHLTHQPPNVPQAQQQAQQQTSRAMAQPGQDFRAGQYDVPLPKGKTRFSHTIANVIIDDEEDEPEEEAYMLLTPNRTAQRLGFSPIPILIPIVIGASDSRAQRAQLLAPVLQESDSDTPVTLRVRLSLSEYERTNLPRKDYVFTLAVKTDDSTADTKDYSLDNTLTIPSGEIEGRVTLILKGDTLAEGDEKLSLQLLYPEDFPYAKHDPTSRKLEHDLTIIDDDAPARLIIVPINKFQPPVLGNNTLRIREGAQGKYRYVLARADGTPVISHTPIRFTLVPSGDGTGYSLNTRQFRIPAGQSQSNSFTVAVTDTPGTAQDSDITVSMSLDMAQPPAWLARASLTTTLILADNDGLPRLRVNNVFPTRPTTNAPTGQTTIQYEEPAGERQQIAVPLALHRAISGQALQFDVSTQDGSATGGADYVTLAKTTVTIADGKAVPTTQRGVIDDEGHLLLTLLGDALAENTERFVVRLNNFRVSSGELSDVYNGVTDVTLHIDIAANDIITKLVPVNAAGAVLSDIRVSENAGTQDIYYELRDSADTAVVTAAPITIDIATRAGAGAPLAGQHYRLSTTRLSIPANASRSGKTTITGILDSLHGTYMGQRLTNPQDYAERKLSLQATPSLSGQADWYRIAQGRSSDTDIVLANATKSVLHINAVPYLPDIATRNLTVAEVDISTPIIIGISHPLPADLTMRLRTHDGSATSPADYAAIDTDIVIPAGKLMAVAQPNAERIILNIVDDTAKEGEEYLTLRLDNFRFASGTLSDVLASQTDITLRVSISEDAIAAPRKRPVCGDCAPGLIPKNEIVPQTAINH